MNKLPSLRQILFVRFKEALKESVIFFAIYALALFVFFGEYEPIFPNGTFERISAAMILLALGVSRAPYTAWAQIITIPLDLLFPRIAYAQFPVTGGTASFFTDTSNFLRIYHYFGGSLMQRYRASFCRVYYAYTGLIDNEDFMEKVCAEDETDTMPKFGFYCTRYSKQIVAIIPLNSRRRWILPEFQHLLFTPLSNDCKS